MSFIIEKRCMECGAPFKGRPDKKFCMDQCRTTFNNRLNRDEINCIRNVNHRLRRNRRILVTLIDAGRKKVRSDTLRLRGFDFEYFTSMLKGNDGRQYFYCYDRGYTPIDPEWYLLVEKEFMV